MPSLDARTERELYWQAIEYVRCRGCFVREPDNRAEWLTPAQIAAKVGLKGTALFKRLRSSNCPPFEYERGKKRITLLLAHEKLMAFLRQPKQPGKRLSKT